MKNPPEVLQTLGALNKRFIHNFVTNDVASHDQILHPGVRATYSAGNHIDRADSFAASFSHCLERF